MSDKYNSYDPNNGYDQNSQYNRNYQYNPNSRYDPNTGYQQYGPNGYYNGQNGYYQNGYNQGFDVRGGFAGDTLSTYTAKTFGWMAAGLFVTFLVALATLYSGLWYYIFSGTFSIILLSIAEIGVVIYMSARVRKISVGGARACFFLYAALTGVTFSIYFLAFDVETLMFAFLATAIFFGALALAAIAFKLQLDSMRPLLFGGLIFLIIFGIVGALTGLEWMQILECWIGIAIFLALTAYDTTKIRDNYLYYQGHGELLAKASIFSALQLYLDFINLFIRILRIFAGRRR